MTPNRFTVFFIVLACVVGLATAPVNAAPDYDEVSMDQLYNQYHEMHDAYFEGTTTVCIVKQDLTTSADTYQQTAYPFPSAAAAVKISSSDANDTGEVVLTYLDSNWDRQTVTHTLTGQTQVATTVTPIRVLSLVCNDSGAQDKTNQGTIYVYTGTATSGVPDSLSTVLAIVPIGAGRSKMCVTSIPRNVSKGLIRGIDYACAESVDFYFYLYTIDRSETYPILKQYGPFYVFQSSGRIPLNIPVNDKFDVYMTGATGTAAQKCWLNLDLYYKKQ
jgi:hypothetical protein